MFVVLELTGKKGVWPPQPSPRTSLGTHVLLGGAAESRTERLLCQERRRSKEALRLPILSPGSLDTEGNDIEPESPLSLTFTV